MGSAILQGVIEACEKEKSADRKPRFSKFIACVNSQASVERLEVRFQKHLSSLKILLKNNLDGIKDADIVMLGCKPYIVEEVLGGKGFAEALNGKLLISFAVGTPIEKLCGALLSVKDRAEYRGAYKKRLNNMGWDIAMVRGMMNLAAQYAQSLTVIEDVELPGDYEDITNWIFSQLGTTSLVAPELFDVGGVIAGTSAAFMTVAIDGMLDGAVAEGIKRAEARKMLAQTLKSLSVLLENGETPDTLREKFSSPRGTTIAGTMSLEGDNVRAAYTRAIIKATKRSKEM